MLEDLIVQNFALIEKLSIRFTHGLNILTGETGAGKSILMGALGVLLGLKADPQSIRSGCDEMSVSGIIKIGNHGEVRQWFSEQGIEPEDESLIIRRVVKKNGRGIIQVQSVPVTLNTLRDLTGLLFDLHGQHEHQSLLHPENHRRLLDQYGGIADSARIFSELYQQLLALRERQKQLVQNEQDRLRQIDLLQFALSEIEEAALNPEEDDQLDQEHLLLANHEKRVHAVESAYAQIAESRGGALVNLRQARSVLSDIVSLDPEIKKIAGQLDSAFYEIEDFARTLDQHLAGINFDPSRLEQVEARLAQIRGLKKKYGDSIKEILQYRERSKADLQSMENYEEEKQKLDREITQREQEIKKQAEHLTQERKKASQGLEKKIEEELRQLGMPKVGFHVDITDKVNKSGRAVYSATGKDHISFLISPNQGEPFKALTRIASGGELSRIMLAIKSILAESDQISSLIFDEVDAGIGGEVALAVGERLKGLSKSKQVLCITHLATLAARADNHIKVEKIGKGGRTLTRTATIKGEQRLEELARMLAGDRQGEVSQRHAVELLEKYGSLEEQ